MMEITVLSGKGGTGKTTITAALASVASKAVFCDNDVDAADLHLIFKPDIQEKHTFISGSTAIINLDACSNCGLCKELCRFEAIHLNENGQHEINPFQCEGCKLCERQCPENAIYSKDSDNNAWFVSNTRFGSLVHAHMGPGEENSGKLVTLVRKKAAELAQQNNKEFIINDGPPGIGCATISSLTGTNRVLIVIEPTKSGLHDVKRLLKLVESFNIKAYAIINKFDVNRILALKIEAYLETLNIPLLAKIPFDKSMVEAMIHGKSIVEYSPQSEISERVRGIWNKLRSIN